MKVAKKFVLLPIDRYNLLKGSQGSQLSNPPLKTENYPKHFEGASLNLPSHPLARKKNRLATNRKQIKPVKDKISPSKISKPPPGIRTQKDSKKGQGFQQKKRKRTKFTKVQWRAL